MSLLKKLMYTYLISMAASENVWGNSRSATAPSIIKDGVTQNLIQNSTYIQTY